MRPAHLAPLSFVLLTACSAAPTGGGATTTPPSKAASKHPDPHAVDVEVGRRFGSDPRTPVKKLVAFTASDAASSGFGLYVLALSWAPNFCCTHESKGQCAGLATSFGADHLTLHGLWPNYTDAESAQAGADYPQFCGRYKACKGRNAPDFCYPDPSDIPAEMSKYGPGYVTDDNFLANHEWPKHGSCSGLDAKTFFADTIGALLKLPGDGGTPDVLRRNVGGEVKPADLQQSFGNASSVLLSCDQSCNLMQVGICLAHDAQGNPTQQIACPDNVTQSDYDNGCITHGCSSIKIQRVGQCSTGGVAHGGGGQSGGRCSSPGQGPACSGDDECTSQGFVRCARSGCCTAIPLQ
jgi:ribonuclease T2